MFVFEILLYIELRPHCSCFHFFSSLCSPSSHLTTCQTIGSREQVHTAYTSRCAAFISFLYINHVYICKCAGFDPHAWPEYFHMPVLMLMLITLLNDGTLIAIGYDNVVPTRVMLCSIYMSYTFNFLTALAIMISLFDMVYSYF